MDPDRRPFPSLPIVTPDPPRLSQQEKYGALYYVGICGLALAAFLVVRFGWGLWSMRNIWWNVYVVHDARRPVDDRILAAHALAGDSRFNDQQRWDIALRKPLPELARYLMAESMGTDLVKSDPDQFARAVALSEGWPPWLRLLGLPAMARAAAEGTTFPAEPLDALVREPDPLFASWVEYIRAVSGEGDRAAGARLRDRAAAGGPDARTAGELAGAIEAGALERATHLDAATRLIRTESPDAARVWQGWAERDGRLERVRP